MWALWPTSLYIGTCPCTVTGMPCRPSHAIIFAARWPPKLHSNIKTYTLQHMIPGNVCRNDTRYISWDGLVESLTHTLNAELHKIPESFSLPFHRLATVHRYQFKQFTLRRIPPRVDVVIRYPVVTLAPWGCVCYRHADPRLHQLIGNYEHAMRSWNMFRRTCVWCMQRAYIASNELIP